METSEAEAARKRKAERYCRHAILEEETSEEEDVHMMAIGSGPQNPKSEHAEKIASIYVDADHTGAVIGNGGKPTDYQRLSRIAEARLCKEDQVCEKTRKDDRFLVKGTKA